MIARFPYNKLYTPHLMNIRTEPCHLSTSHLLTLSSPPFLLTTDFDDAFSDTIQATQ